ncbi:hypothetical protein B7R21_19150 [Subtercola boreus]|uniref:Uncharacterized protein n=1 Tax=Subtercola boreus TaxID=120213 RepID=A0A3E0VA01_9MICO|nr:hypothetical protein B7R21_19150 [Subtercola boreus]
MRNKWWDKGYTWKGLAWASAGFFALAVIAAFTRLFLDADAWWFVVPVVLIAVSFGWAWRARQLFIFERAQSAGDQDGS